MKLEDYIVLAGLVILAVGIFVPWLKKNNPDFATTVVGIVLIITGLVAGSETLKKGGTRAFKEKLKEKTI